jgi:glycosyltransferase involved in cell wall biosynthesis
MLVGDSTHSFQSRSGFSPGLATDAPSIVPSHVADHSIAVSLVIPAYNEEARLTATLEKYIDALESHCPSYEIIVVADGQDQTSEVAQRYENRNVRVIRANYRLGKGGALLRGIRSARYETIGFVDADGSLSAKDLVHLLERASHVDCVVATRWGVDSHWDRSPPLSRKIASRAFNFLVRGILGLPFTDTQCGAKFFSRGSIERVVGQIGARDFTIDVSLLYHLHKMGSTIEEVPISWQHNYDSKVTIGKTAPIMLFTLIGIRIMNLPLGKYVPMSVVRKFQQFIGAS